MWLARLRLERRLVAQWAQYFLDLLNVVVGKRRQFSAGDAVKCIFARPCIWTPDLGVHARRNDGLSAVAQDLHCCMALKLEVPRRNWFGRAIECRKSALSFLGHRRRKCIHRSNRGILIVPIEGDDICAVGLLAEPHTDTSARLRRCLRSSRR